MNSWQGHSTWVGAGDDSTESRSVVQQPRIPSVICPERLRMLFSDEPLSCCAAGTNGCVDLRRRAFPFCEQVSAEWSTCPGSMARRARDRVAPLRRSSGGSMSTRVGRLSGGGRRNPVTIRKASLMVASMRRV